MSNAFHCTFDGLPSWDYDCLLLCFQRHRSLQFQTRCFLQINSYCINLPVHLRDKTETRSGLATYLHRKIIWLSYWLHSLEKKNNQKTCTLAHVKQHWIESMLRYSIMLKIILVSELYNGTEGKVDIRDIGRISLFSELKQCNYSKAGDTWQTVAAQLTLVPMLSS